MYYILILMIKFDKMKLITSIDYISDINVSIFLTSVKNDEVLSYKYQQDKPYSLLILVDYSHNELVLEFTGKILLDKYSQLINSETIKDCLSWRKRSIPTHLERHNPPTIIAKMGLKRA